jgi:hypothetical protein
MSGAVERAFWMSAAPPVSNGERCVPHLASGAYHSGVPTGAYHSGSARVVRTLEFMDRRGNPNR